MKNLEFRIWDIIKLGALLGIGMEFSTTIMWQATDMIRSLFGLAIG